MTPTTRAAANKDGAGGQKREKMAAAELKVSKQRAEKVRKDKIKYYKELVKELKDHAGLALVVEGALGRGGLVATDEVKKKVADEVVAYVEEILRDSGL